MRVFLIAGGEHGIIADIVSRKPYSATVVNKSSTALKDTLSFLDEDTGTLAHDLVLITDGGLSANPEENELYLEKLIGATKARVSIVTRDFLFSYDSKNVKVVCQRWFCAEKDEIDEAFAEPASDSRSEKIGGKIKLRGWGRPKPTASADEENGNSLERIVIDKTSRAVIFTGHRGAGVTSTAVGVALSAANRGLRTVFADFDTEYRAANLYFKDFNSQAEDSEEVASSLIRVLARPQNVDTAAVNSGGTWVTSLSYSFEDSRLMEQHFTTAKIIGIVIGSILVAIIVFFTLNHVLELRFFADIKTFFVELFDTLWGNLEKYNRKRRSERIKRENIVRRKEDLFVKYHRLIDDFLKSFNIQIPLETATSLIAILFAIVVLITSLFLRDITVSFILAVSITIALFTWFSRESRVRRAARAEAIAEAEDAICPLARDGVLVAVKKVMETDEYIHKDIRVYFREFIDSCETRGFSFRQAMKQLNRQLGSRFDNFAEKAITFEYNERKGMADIFLDIVDENAVIREINAKKEELFKKMNRDFLMKTLIIILFLLYALSVQEFRNFMMFTTPGKFINSLCLNVICISFAWGQALQGSLELKRQKPKAKG